MNAMATTIRLENAPRRSLWWDFVARAIRDRHYLRKMPDPRTSIEAYVVHLNIHQVGALVFGRPEATRCADWYGSVEDQLAGRCEVTRWQVLNLARVWLHPAYQAGGEYCTPECVPGFVDRRGQFRSTLASAVLRSAVETIGSDYLQYRPPCFLDEPYQIDWLLSYCDTLKHRGTIYQSAGWELYRTNGNGIQTWRIRLPPLTADQHAAIQEISAKHPRSLQYRAKRQQMKLELL